MENKKIKIDIPIVSYGIKQCKANFVLEWKSLGCGKTINFPTSPNFRASLPCPSTENPVGACRAAFRVGTVDGELFYGFPRPGKARKERGLASGTRESSRIRAPNLVVHLAAPQFFFPDCYAGKIPWLGLRRSVPRFSCV